jgi:hypothetical protein
MVITVIKVMVPAKTTAVTVPLVLRLRHFASSLDEPTIWSLQMKTRPRIVVWRALQNDIYNNEHHRQRQE